MNTEDKDIIDALNSKLYWEVKENKNLLDSLKKTDLECDYLRNKVDALNFELKVMRIAVAVMALFTGVLLGIN